MTEFKQIFDYLCEIAPLELQEDWDNAGFLFGRCDRDIRTCVLALDATMDVIREAKDADLIITHHPLIFTSVSCVLSDDVTGMKIIELAKNDTNVISMHTNLDKALVNDVLIEKLGVSKAYKAADYLRYGTLEKEMDFSDYLEFVKDSLANRGLRFYDSGKKVNQVACIGGAGDSGFFDAVKLGCDTFITADIRHHVFLAAKELGVNLIDADHFNTENPVMYRLRDMLSNRFADVDFYIAESNEQVTDYE